MGIFDGLTGGILGQVEAQILPGLLSKALAGTSWHETDVPVVPRNVGLLDGSGQPSTSDFVPTGFKDCDHDI